MKLEQYKKIIEMIENSYQNANKEFLMKNAIVKPDLKIYINNGILFGQKGNFFFRLEYDEIIQINANNNSELSVYNKWKFDSKTNDIPILCKLDLELWESIEQK